MNANRVSSSSSSSTTAAAAAAAGLMTGAMLSSVLGSVTSVTGVGSGSTVATADNTRSSLQSSGHNQIKTIPTSTLNSHTTAWSHSQSQQQTAVTVVKSSGVSGSSGLREVFIPPNESPTNTADTPDTAAASLTAVKRPVMMICILGGLTYLEIAAFRHLAKDPLFPYEILLATTSLTNGSKFIQSFTASEVHNHANSERTLYDKRNTSQ